MRIIGGIFRGKKILEPLDKKTRPLKDLTKESIFNILAHSKKIDLNLDNSIVLDLFSGVGSFGIECLSRGVKEVIFVENYSNALILLKKNLANLKKNLNFSILEKNIYDDNLINQLRKKFDIIFLDPPFKNEDLNSLLIKIKENNILNKNGVIIL